MLLCLFVSWQLLMHIQNRKDCVQLPSIFHLLYRSLFVVHCFVFLSQFVGWAWVVRVHVSLIQAVALGKQWWQQQQHTRQFRSFYCSFKHTFVPCHDIQSDVILTSLIFHGVKRVHILWCCIVWLVFFFYLPNGLYFSKQPSINYYNKVLQANDIFVPEPKWKAKRII